MACDHYNRFREDFRIAKELKHNATRFSVEWSRVEPEEGEFNERELDHYKEIISTLRELSIEPFVTLWHFTLPLWLVDKGGWEHKDAPELFARYARKVASCLDVSFWLTLNEPEVYSGNAYLVGIWPPQKENPLVCFSVLKNLIEAHLAAYKVIKEIKPGAKVGIAKSNVYFEALGNTPVNLALKYVADKWWNFYFLDKINDCQDFIGLNFYFHYLINYGFNKNDNRILSDMSWELYPEGIYHTLIDLKCYGKPIYITENGLADADDEHRAWFIFEVLRNVHKAITQGADIRGYLHWSLLDNFEWNHGFWPRFGLLEIDRQTLERRIRPSARFLADVIAQNGISGASFF